MTQTDRRFAIFAVCAVLALLAVAGVNLVQAERAGPPARVIAYSEFLDEVGRGQVRRVKLAGGLVAGVLTDGSRFQTYAPEDPDLIRTLRARAVAIAARPPPATSPSLLGVVGSLLPLVLLIAVTLFFMRRMPGAAGGGRLGKSRARLLEARHDRVTFEDVAGVDEAKESLKEIVDFLREPQTAGRLGGRIPRGVLLVGPPGSGKTLLARAVAGEAGVSMFTISGSDFVEMFVGIGAARVRDMFEQARKSAPCVVFVDEIDAVGRRRGAGVGGGNDEREQTLNQLLVEMDGVDRSAGVILIAATNRPDILDPALIRPGRFDREVVVDHPDVAGRARILAVHGRVVPLAPDVDLVAVARGTPGFSGAELANLVNEAALLAARRGRSDVGAMEFDEAKDTVTMGAERRSRAMSEAERRLTAYREGGRAIVALHVPAADPVHKATIVARGRRTGLVNQLPDEDASATTLEQATSRLAILLAGRAAETLVFGRDKITSGVAADIEEATKLARTMVERWGFSDRLSPIAYGEDEEEVFLGRSVARRREMPEETAQAIASEIRRFVEEALAEANRILEGRRTELDHVAQALLVREVLSGSEIRDLVAGRAVDATGASGLNGVARTTSTTRDGEMQNVCKFEGDK